MDSKVALDKIKEAEEKAQEIIEQAQKESHGILHEAKIEKERIIKHTQEQARLDSQKLKAKIQESTLREVALIETQAEEKTKTLKEKAQVNLDKALKFLKDRMEA